MNWTLRAMGLFKMCLKIQEDYFPAILQCVIRETREYTKSIYRLARSMLLVAQEALPEQLFELINDTQVILQDFKYRWEWYGKN